jgi:diguanylate cyclase (GGDEF)-like protein
VFVIVVLALGLGVSAVSSWAWYSYTNSQRRQAVSSSLGNVRSILGTTLERDNDLVAMVNALVATHPQLTNRSLAAVLSRLDPPRRYPGSIAFTYVENVSRAGLSRFEAVTQDDPPLGVAAAASVPVPSSMNSHLGYCLTRLAVVDLLPSQLLLKDMLLSWVSSYLSADFNFCASSFEGLLAASAKTGRSAVASVISLIKPPPGMPAIPAVLNTYLVHLPIFVEVSPVYTGSRIPATSRARAGTLAGWTMGIFDASRILSLAVANEKNVSLVLAYAPPGSRMAVLAHAGQPQTGVAVRRLTFPADPGWVIDVAVNPRANGFSPATQGLAVVSGALAVTVLLVLLLSLLVRSRRSALELVEARTAELRHQALHDSLTGLPNRFLVNERTHDLLKRARREGVRIAVFFIDLDDFKTVNDTFGHGIGDELLRAVAARLSASVRDCDTVGRLGGDEFVVLSEVPDEGLNVLAERLLSVLREPFKLGETNKIDVATSASIGIATGLPDSPEDLLRDADIAMYKAKSAGKNCHVVFRQELHRALRNQLSLEANLSEAFTDHQFFLAYQPIVDLETGLPNNFEALLRWQHPERGVIGPAAFIPVLESSDLMIDVGRWVLAEACRQAKSWHDLGHPVGMSVNLGARQLRYEVLVDHARQALDAAGLDPGSLTLEITESMAMIDPKMTARHLSALSSLGIHIALDDFGTGYSSISCLREFPVDTLKIDRSVVTRAASDDTSFLDTLIRVGKSLSLVTIAKGIEEVSQLKHVKHQGCEQGQGFLFCKPLPPEEIERIIKYGHYLVGGVQSSIGAVS